LTTQLKESILGEYESTKQLNGEFCKKVEMLLIDILKDSGINYHSIDSRLKEESSLATKVENADGKYNSLSDITDISGLRIVTYFSEDVDKVASIIQGEFSVDEENSVDKRLKLDPDRFGYLSLHYVVTLSEERTKFAEYKRFKELKVEIQIRSILQHAWAEIEHDLGYKNKNAVPNVVRRDFSRLASILELADEEFIRIRQNLENYNEDIQLKMGTTNENILIDKITMQVILEKPDNLIQIVDKEIGLIVGTNIVKEISEEGLNVHIERLKFLGFNTLDEMLNSLEQHKNEIINFTKVWLSGNEVDYVPQAISLFYLGYVVLAEKEDIEILNEYIDGYLNNDKRDKKELIEKIIKTYKDVK